MDKKIILSSGATAHIYETSTPGVHIIDVYKNGKIVYSLYDSGKPTDKHDTVDANKISIREVQEIKSALENSN